MPSLQHGDSMSGIGLDKTKVKRVLLTGIYKVSGTTFNLNVVVEYDNKDQLGYIISGLSGRFWENIVPNELKMTEAPCPSIPQ